MWDMWEWIAQERVLYVWHHTALAWWNKQRWMEFCD
jgi:hypothetical protein